VSLFSYISLSASLCLSFPKSLFQRLRKKPREATSEKRDMNSKSATEEEDSCCSALQCVAVCCSALQCVAVRCSVLQLKSAREDRSLPLKLCFLFPMSLFKNVLSVSHVSLLDSVFRFLCLSFKMRFPFFMSLF